MTQYYIDFDAGSDSADGLSIGNAWLTLAKYMNATRTAGDIATVRRGTSETVSSDINPLSRGNTNDPIVAEADFDDSWADFANSAQTYTPVWGSKTMEASASITGISVGDWVYNSTDADDPRELSYEVGAVSGTTLTLKLPFKGSAGATKTLKVMPSAPHWNDTTRSYSINFNQDGCWTLHGIKIQSSDTSGCIRFIGYSGGVIWKDCIFLNDNSHSGGECISVGSGTGHTCQALKCRFGEVASCIGAITAGTALNMKVRDCLFEGNTSIFGSHAFELVNCGQFNILVDQCEFTGYGNADECLALGNGAIFSGNGEIRFRNCTFDTAFVMDYAVGGPAGGEGVTFEDYNGTVGDHRWFNRQYTTTANSETEMPIQATSSTLRAGGGDFSVSFTPTNNGFGTNEQGKLEVLEYPIWLLAEATTITFFFKSDATAQWTASPTADELYVEVEYWRTNTQREKKRSTGTVDFTTDTDFDQSLAVTITPSQAGVGYVRLVYGKDKEAGKTNKFYIDIKPVIS